MKKILVWAQPTAACINKGLEEVIAEGRCRGHRIGGVGHRRMPEPSYRPPTLVARASRDRRRRRRRPYLARPPEGTIAVVCAWGAAAAARAFGRRRRTSPWPLAPTQATAGARVSGAAVAARALGNRHRRARWAPSLVRQDGGVKK